MKLTLVVHQFLPRYFTGTEQYVYAVAKAMQARGHDVEVFALEPDFSYRKPTYCEERDVFDGIPVVRTWFWYCIDRDYDQMDYRNPLVAARFASYLAERSPDVVHFFHVRYLGSALIAEARAQQVPSVVHLMDFWFLCPAIVLRRSDGSLCEGPPAGGRGCIDCQNPPLAAELEARDIDAELGAVAPLAPRNCTSLPSPTHRALTWMERPALLRQHLLLANRIVAPSRFLRSMFAKNGIPEERIDVLAYGLSEQRLAACRAARKPRAPGMPLRCTYMGSIAEYKGVDVAVDAVLGSKAAVQLSVYGRLQDFADYSGPLVERSRHDPRIRFPGPFAGTQLGEVLAETDVLVVPSRWYENTPFVLLEAFAAGVPVLAADLGGMREIVRDGQNGELFAPDDPADLRRRLERLATEPERLSRYAQGIEPPKSMAQNACEIEALYFALCGGESPA